MSSCRERFILQLIREDHLRKQEDKLMALLRHAVQKALQKADESHDKEEKKPTWLLQRPEVHNASSSAVSLDALIVRNPSARRFRRWALFAFNLSLTRAR